MKKITWFITACLSCAVLFSACDNTETYADKLANEKKAIKKFLQDENIEVLNSYPTDSVFGPKQYFKDPSSGVYIRVIDPGNGRRISATDKAEVYMRFSDVRRIGTADTTHYSNTSTASIDAGMTLTYGLPTTYLYPAASYTANTRGYNQYRFMSPACIIPLKYVRDNAIVSLLVPFVAGSTEQNNNYVPYYYGRLIYKFEPKLEVANN